jgi:hypothetical protein
MMRHRSELWLGVAIAVFALSGLTALRLMNGPGPRGVLGIEPSPPRVAPLGDDARGWFASNRMYCNHVEVETRLRARPAPDGPEGAMYEAACYALAGRVDQARTAIESLPPDVRYKGAGVVFEAIHPAADAGDEVAAGPLMELVVDFWPNHYMALYHAGAAAFERGERTVAVDYLRRFLSTYPHEDGWTADARSKIDQAEEGAAVG